MAEDKKYGTLPNFQWPPERYYNLASYVLMFNGIANNHDDYGIENSNGDQFITAYIKDHIEELCGMKDYAIFELPPDMPIKPLKPGNYDALSADSPTKKKYDQALAQYNADYAVWINGGPAADAKLAAARAKQREKFDKKIADFKKDLPNLVAQAKEFSNKVNAGSGENTGYLNKMLTNEQMTECLREKYNGVRRWHEDVRKSFKGKSGLKDKDGDYAHWHDLDNARAEKRDKDLQVRRNGWRTFRRIIYTILAGGITAASVAMLLAAGGAALPMFEGITALAGAVRGARRASYIASLLTGFFGTVGGAAFTKSFFGRFLDSWAKGRKLRRDRREFMKGFGKYADKTEQGKTRQARGFLTRKQRYYEDQAIVVFLEKGELKGKNRFLRKYLNRALRRGSLFNPGADGGMPVDLKQLQKESGYYKFVTDPVSKQKFGFQHMFGLLGAAKSMNVNDVHSVQAETILAEELLREKSPSLLALKDKLHELVNGEEKFKGDNKNKYKQLMFDMSDKIMEAMDRELFESSYTSDLVGTMKDIYKVDEVKDRYLKTREGDCTEMAENAFKFIENLRTDTFAGGVLSSDIGASVKNQIVMTADNMKDACSRYGIPTQVPDPMAPPPLPGVPTPMIPNPEIVKINEICDHIGAITHTGDSNDSDAEAKIATLASTSKRAKTYLEYMLKKKRAESTLDSTGIDNAIASVAGMTIPASIKTSIEGISASTTPSQIETIKNDILADASLATPSGARNAALNLVSKQIEAVERKKRNDVTAQAMECIRVNGFHEYAEFMDKIPKDENADLNPYDLSVTLKAFRKVHPPEMAKFLEYKLKDKVYSIFQKIVARPEYQTGGDRTNETVINNIRDYLRKVNICEEGGVIDSWQKDACAKVMQANISKVFEPYLKKVEEEFMKDPKATRDLAYNLLQSINNAGFAEFLNSGTIEATALKERITRINEASALTGMMTATVRGGENLVCADDVETKKVLRIFFQKDRNGSDPLYNILGKMREISANTAGFGSGEPIELITAMGATSDSLTDRAGGTGASATVSTTDFASKSFVYRMCQLADSINVTSDATGATTFNNGTTNVNISHEDAVAMLLLMKKRTLAMVKAQMNRLYAIHGNNGQIPAEQVLNNLTATNASLFDDFVKSWKVLAEKIDTKMNQLQAKPLGKEFGGYDVTVEETIGSAFNVKNFNAYRNSSKMEM